MYSNLNTNLTNISENLSSEHCSFQILYKFSANKPVFIMCMCFYCRYICIIIYICISLSNDYFKVLFNGLKICNKLESAQTCGSKLHRWGFLLCVCIHTRSSKEKDTLQFSLGFSGTDSSMCLRPISHLQVVQLLVAIHMHGEWMRMDSHEDALANTHLDLEWLG